MRIYIAGPMTGHPDFNHPAFNKAADKLRALGYEVENPADCPLPVGTSWGEYMRYGIARLVSCDAVALLDSWQSSPGACIEFRLARNLSMPRKHISEWNQPPLYPSERKAAESRYSLPTGMAVTDLAESCGGYGAFRAVGWTDDDLIEHGHMYVVLPTAHPGLVMENALDKGVLTPRAHRAGFDSVQECLDAGMTRQEMRGTGLLSIPPKADD